MERVQQGHFFSVGLFNLYNEVFIKVVENLPEVIIAECNHNNMLQRKHCIYGSFRRKPQ